MENLQTKTQDSLREDWEVLRALLNSPGWALLDSVLRMQIRLREKEHVKMSITSLDSAFGAAYTQGELAGIRLVKELPRLLLEDLEEDIDAGNS